MEILANNGHNMTNEVGSVGLPVIRQIEDGLFNNELLNIGHTTFGVDDIVDPSGVYLVDTKKRTFDEESKDFDIPFKRPAVRSSSDALTAERDPAPVSLEAILIDATEEVTEERGAGIQSTLGYFKQVPGSFITCSIVSCPPEMNNPVSTEAPSICESAHDTPNLQKTVFTLPSVDCGIDRINHEGDLITHKSGRSEVEDTKAIIEFRDSLGSVTEENIGKEGTVILRNTFKNGYVDFEADEPVISNVVGEEMTDVLLGTKKRLPDTVIDDELLSPRLIGVDSEKIDGKFHVKGNDKGGGRMDRQGSGIAMALAATSGQYKPPSLKMRMSLKLPGESSLKVSPGLAVGTSLPVKKIFFKKAPASAKLLLASGLLDGHQVRYLGRGGHIMLTGVIQEGGVRCDCTACKGVQVVNVSAFEKHAGSSARHPSDFIFLENGKCIKDILEIGWNANKEKNNLMDVLKSAIGELGGALVKIRGREHPLIQNRLVEKKPRLSLDSKPRLPLDAKLRMSLDSKARTFPDTKFRSTSEMKASGNDGRISLLRDRIIREKEKENETPSPLVLRRETSGPNLHKALFLPGGLEDNTELGYYVKGQKFLSGVKKGAGILCSCCEQLISCSLFEQHAGWGSRRNPYTSIYLADGRSLHDAAQSLVVKQTVKQEGLTSSMIEHLDQCVECGDSGDLQLCTGCPNAYHQDCLGSEDLSTGDFFCPDCQEQRFGRTKDRHRSMAKRRLKAYAKTSLAEDLVTGRCTRLLQAVPEAASIGGCVFCKSGDFAKSGFGPMTTMLCDQCEREYHVGCLKKHGLEDLKELPEGEWFCGQDCKYIHSILSLLVANGPEPLADSIISKVLKNRQQLDKSDELGESGSGGFEWQLLHGRGGDPANGKTLAEALQIFSECFDPIADGVSGGDLIPLMVYRRSIRDQDFGGIYCVVLKEFGKVVSTALIRVFGRQLAELPLLATNPTHQGQGHCKALLFSIERLLGVLRVERLALPAAEGAQDIWLLKFGFRRMPEEQTKNFRTDLNIMIFTGSFMLEKEIAPLEIIGSA